MERPTLFSFTTSQQRLELDLSTPIENPVLFFKNHLSRLAKTAHEARTDLRRLWEAVLSRCNEDQKNEIINEYKHDLPLLAILAGTTIDSRDQALCRVIFKSWSCWPWDLSHNVPPVLSHRLLKQLKALGGHGCSRQDAVALMDTALGRRILRDSNNLRGVSRKKSWQPWDASWAIETWRKTRAGQQTGDRNEDVYESEDVEDEHESESINDGHEREQLEELDDNREEEIGDGQEKEQAPPKKADDRSVVQTTSPTNSRSDDTSTKPPLSSTAELIEGKGMVSPFEQAATALGGRSGNILVARRSKQRNRRKEEVEEVTHAASTLISVKRVHPSMSDGRRTRARLSTVVEEDEMSSPSQSSSPGSSRGRSHSSPVVYCGRQGDLHVHVQGREPSEADQDETLSDVSLEMGRHVELHLSEDEASNVDVDDAGFGPDVDESSVLEGVEPWTPHDLPQGSSPDSAIKVTFCPSSIDNGQQLTPIPETSTVTPSAPLLPTPSVDSDDMERSGKATDHSLDFEKVGWDHSELSLVDVDGISLERGESSSRDHKRASVKIDCSRLRRNGELNDAIINEILDLFSACRPAITVLDSHHILFEGSKVTVQAWPLRVTPAVSTIIAPLHYTHHWTFLQVDLLCGTVSHFDSTLASRDIRARYLYPTLIELQKSFQKVPSINHLSALTLELVTGAQQPNNFDCGVYCLVNCIHALGRRRIPNLVNARLWREVFLVILGARCLLPTADTNMEATSDPVEIARSLKHARHNLLDIEAAADILEDARAVTTCTRSTLLGNLDTLKQDVVSLRKALNALRECTFHRVQAEQGLEDEIVAAERYLRAQGKLEQRLSRAESAFKAGIEFLRMRAASEAGHVERMREMAIGWQELAREEVKRKSEEVATLKDRSREMDELLRG